MDNNFQDRFVKLVQTIQKMVLLVIMLLVLGIAGLYFISDTLDHPLPGTLNNETVVMDMEENQMQYGEDLIAHTAKYFGPDGTVRQNSNGMNCQNCHLDAGTKKFGNNYWKVATEYPRVRGRSGKMESVEMRINDCFRRSLNGDTIALESREMKAMVAYITSVASPEETGAGIFSVAMLDRPANPATGKIGYEKHCVVCHGAQGEGMRIKGANEYVYPPLWGSHSYNTAAGLYRLSRFAGYIKTNMPFGATAENPILSNEEAWDIAAYVNSQERPIKIFKEDWPDISKKPIDHPFGPFADNYSELQHKFGPFKPMLTNESN